jgi:hypothetical protein
MIMGILRISLLAAGFLAALLGLVWIGQGSRYFPYPASTFMIGQSQASLQSSDRVEFEWTSTPRRMPGKAGGFNR